MYRRTTRSIEVAVQPTYLEEHSRPDEGRYVWGYHIRITNRGTETVQLRTRHWRITDATGHLERVDGPGVIGEEPILAPGKAHEYESFCQLRTSSGMMVGTYEMETEKNERFMVEIPAFSLDIPQQERRLH